MYNTYINLKKTFIEAALNDLNNNEAEEPVVISDEDFYLRHPELIELESITDKFEMEESFMDDKKWEAQRKKELEAMHKHDLKVDALRKKELEAMRKEELKWSKEHNKEYYNYLRKQNKNKTLTNLKGNVNDLKDRVYNVLTTISKGIKNTARGAALASIIPLSLIGGAVVGDMIGSAYSSNGQSMIYAIYQEIKKAIDSKSQDEINAAANKISEKAIHDEIPEGELLGSFLMELGVKKPN